MDTREESAMSTDDQPTLPLHDPLAGEPAATAPLATAGQPQPPRIRWAGIVWAPSSPPSASSPW